MLAIAIMAAVDLLVLLISGSLAHYVSHTAITVVEKLFSILVAALAIQLIVDGLAELGVVSTVIH